MHKTLLLFYVMFSSFLAQGKEGGGELKNPPKKPTVIDMGVELIEVEKIEPASKEFPKVFARFRLNLSWLDQRLSEPLSSTDSLVFQDEDASDKLSEIFDPKIAILNGTEKLEHQFLTIYKNGVVKLIKVIRVDIPAYLKLSRYPFDNQIFDFQFGSLYFDASELELRLDEGQTKLFRNAAPTAWHFIYHNNYISKMPLSDNNMIYSAFNFIVNAERDPRSFLWRLLIPLLAIVMLSWNVFWIYEDTQESLEICFLFLLTVVAFHQIANDMLPMVPFFTFMDSLVFISYLFIITPSILVIITARLEKGGKENKAANLRRTCRWAMPLAFVMSILFSTIVYFV